MSRFKDSVCESNRATENVDIFLGSSFNGRYCQIKSKRIKRDMYIPIMYLQIIPSFRNIILQTKRIEIPSKYNFLVTKKTLIIKKKYNIIPGTLKIEYILY